MFSLYVKNIYYIDMAITETPLSKTGYATDCYANYVAMVPNSIFRTLSNISDDDVTLCFDTEHDTLQIIIKNLLSCWLLWTFCNHGN